MKPLCIRSLCVGTGLPKLCVPLVGRTTMEVLQEAKKITRMPVDMVEWRIDFFDDVEDVEIVKKTLQKLREILGDMPLLATYRKIEEGGKKAISNARYVVIYENIVRMGYVDAIDIAANTKIEDIKKVVKLVHTHKMKVIISEHDIIKTPSIETIVKRCKDMQSLHADIVKVAYMPTNVQDVWHQFEAIYQLQQEGFMCPIISVSMGELGAISRISGELFFSSITFVSGLHASAPGQMDAKDVYTIQKRIHKYIH